MKTKRPTDMNQLAASIVAIASGDENIDNDGQITGADIALRDNDTSGKNPNAVALGRLGGLVGGKARAKTLTAEQRREIASKAARKRWADDDGDIDNG